MYFEQSEPCFPKPVQEYQVFCGFSSRVGVDAVSLERVSPVFEVPVRVPPTTSLREISGEVGRVGYGVGGATKKSYSTRVVAAGY